jgi:hypothetical protein
VKEQLKETLLTPVTHYRTNILSRVGVAYGRVSDWMIGFTDTSHVHNSGLQVIADLHTLQFTVTHALGFSIFFSCIMATEL